MDVDNGRAGGRAIAWMRGVEWSGVEWCLRVEDGGWRSMGVLGAGSGSGL